ncbi:hypothetical protein BQ8794_90072 [Mesorhizobium prunaredense]|uniref:Uncharacterized protein n=1 Tax=Mesorhizobium prunaredense TaxID=1631249 RepID=A0A1R3VJ12_9HYPH|nr:hypothetical protein BQ8794_90072 [Mesorhizobium prunaredense]
MRLAPVETYTSDQPKCKSIVRLNGVSLNGALAALYRSDAAKIPIQQCLRLKQRSERPKKSVGCNFQAQSIF